MTRSMTWAGWLVAMAAAFLSCAGAREMAAALDAPYWLEFTLGVCAASSTLSFFRVSGIFEPQKAEGA